MQRDDLQTLMRRAGFSRRSFLASTASMAAALAVSRKTRGGGPAARFSRDPFSLGVASGDPSADGMVLWTKLAQIGRAHV